MCRRFEPRFYRQPPIQDFSYYGGRGGMGAPPSPHSTIVFETHPIKTDAPPPQRGIPHLKIKLRNWKTTLHCKAKPPSRKWFLEKNPEKSEAVINTCVSVIKQHWKKMAQIPQEHDFLTCSIQNFVRKVKQFAWKYCIAWLTDMANKLRHRKILGFILCDVLL